MANMCQSPKRSNFRHDATIGALRSTVSRPTGPPTVRPQPTSEVEILGQEHRLVEPPDRFEVRSGAPEHPAAEPGQEAAARRRSRSVARMPTDERSIRTLAPPPT